MILMKSTPLYSLSNVEHANVFKTKKDEEKNEKEVNTLAPGRGRYACSRPESTHHTDGILFAVPFTGLTLSGLHYRDRGIIPS